MNTNTHHHVIRPGQGEAVTPLEQIAEYARRTAHDARRPGREGWAHNSFHDLVLAHGRVFEPAPLPEDIYPALPGHCFKAATILADQHALTYVEGLVLLPDTRTVTEHAWCTTWSGQVIDPSLGGDTALAYLGIAFTTAFRRQAAARPGGRWSVFSADQDGGGAQNLGLLQHGLPVTGTLEIGKPPGSLAPASPAKPTPAHQADAAAPSTAATSRADRSFPSFDLESAPRAGRHREERDAPFVAADVRPEATAR